MSEGTSIREVEGPKEFYSLLHSTGLHSLTYDLYDFYTKYKNIGVGCGCQRKNREAVAKNAYIKSVSSLTPEQKSAMKETLSVNKVRFYVETGIFAEI
tara:strand:+ start:1977 stop:2270 length:294 start_codon:yes stop_codon:yes gene_type:complete